MFISFPPDECSSMTQTDNVCSKQWTRFCFIMHCDNDAYDDGVVSACRSRWSHMKEITQSSAEFSGPRKSDDDVTLTEYFFPSQCNICYKKKTKLVPWMWAAHTE